MKNIEIFKAISALALATCYENFPLKVNVSPYTLALKLDDEYWSESLNPVTENVSDHIRNKSPAAIAKPTIEWMASSGLITYEAFREVEFINVCLTAKGLEAIESDHEFGTKLLTAAKDIAIDELKSQAKVQLGSVFTDILSWSIQKSPTIFQAVTHVLSQ